MFTLLVIRYRWFMRGAGFFRQLFVLTGLMAGLLTVVLCFKSLSHRAYLTIDPPGELNAVCVGYEDGAAWGAFAFDESRNEWHFEIETGSYNDLKSMPWLPHLEQPYQNDLWLQRYLVPMSYLICMASLPVLYHLTRRFFYIDLERRPCMNCGYDLRGATQSKGCPECGHVSL